MFKEHSLKYDLFFKTLLAWINQKEIKFLYTLIKKGKNALDF